MLIYYIFFQISQLEYDRILEQKQSRSPEQEENEKSKLLTRNDLNIYKQPDVYKPIIILIVLFLFQQLSCAYVFIFYAVDIFKRIGGDLQNSLNAYVALVLLGTIRFVMSLVSACISKRVGRRPTMFFSAIGMSITILTAGFCFGRTSNNLISYLVLIYICFSSIGYFVIPWTLISEILPIKVRGKIGGLMISVAYVFMFGIVKSFPFILDNVKFNHLFYGLFLANVCGLIFMKYNLPETLGKSFVEIEEYFNTK